MLKVRKKDVDARERGHDAGEVIQSHRNCALANRPGCTRAVSQQKSLGWLTLRSPALPCCKVSRPQRNACGSSAGHCQQAAAEPEKSSNASWDGVRRCLRCIHQHSPPRADKTVVIFAALRGCKKSSLQSMCFSIVQVDGARLDQVAGSTYQNGLRARETEAALIGVPTLLRLFFHGRQLPKLHFAITDRFRNVICPFVDCSPPCERSSCSNASRSALCCRPQSCSLFY